LIIRLDPAAMDVDCAVVVITSAGWSFGFTFRELPNVSKLLLLLVGRSSIP
jgi:hypothetical protein